MAPPPRVLEISIISAHDLALVSKSMKTYSIAWVDPERKLATRIDQTGLNNPTWNEKLSFRVDDRFLADENSAIMIEIYAAAWLKDALIGSVRVLISNLFENLITHNSSSSTRYVALHVRRPSGRPQGIINLGISLVDNKLRSMPLFAEMCPPGGNFSEVSADNNGDFVKEQNNNNGKPKDDQEIEKIKPKDNVKTKLRRSYSDRTDLTSEDYFKNEAPPAASSTITGSICDSSLMIKGGGGNGRGSGGGSVLNGSQCYSDVGPSASVVAAAIAKGLYKTPAQVKTSADNGGGLIDEELRAREMEKGMRLMVERWRTERPPIYDNSKIRANSKQGGRVRRRSDGGGLFSCFGNAFGCEISITCGGSNKNMRNFQNGKVCNLSSVDGQSYV